MDTRIDYILIDLATREIIRTYAALGEALMYADPRTTEFRQRWTIVSEPLKV